MNYGSKLQADESGQTFFADALGAIANIGFPGLSVNLRQIRNTRRNLQLAAEATEAALAIKIGTANCDSIQSAAKNSPPEDKTTGVPVATNGANSYLSEILLTKIDPSELYALTMGAPSWEVTSSTSSPLIGNSPVLVS